MRCAKIILRCRSLPQPLLALLGGELIECFGLLFAQKDLVVVLEAIIVFVSRLSQQFGVLIKNSVFSYGGLCVDHDSAQKTHEAERVHAVLETGLERHNTKQALTLS